jgi:hypothetical protein
LADRVSHLTPVPDDLEALKAWLAEHSPGDEDPWPENKEIPLPAPPSEPGLLTIAVTLEETEPSVWRRIEVPGDLTLDQLHDVLQPAMGWTDSHLHRFWVGAGQDASYFVTDFDLEEGDEGTPETAVRVDQVLREVGDRLRYEYDFGDGWEHDLRLEEVAPVADDPRPRCVNGAHECPPEDCGGPGGYQALAAWDRAGRPADAVPEPFDSLEHVEEWLPLDWDADAFDAAETDLRIQAAFLSGRLLDSVNPACLGALLHVGGEEMARVATWLSHASTTELGDDDVEELTRPWRTLLAVLGGGVELSASGYLPPAVVRELCSALGIEEFWLGKAARESNVRPLLAFRKALQQGGLVHVSRRVLTPTIAGIQYGDDPAELWRHVGERLPIARTEAKRDVGWFTLLALAGGVGEGEVFDEVARLCDAAGWEADGRPFEDWQVRDLVRPTLALLLGPDRRRQDGWPAWLDAAAADVVFGRR